MFFVLTICMTVLLLSCKLESVVVEYFSGMSASIYATFTSVGRNYKFCHTIMFIVTAINYVIYMGWSLYIGPVSVSRYMARLRAIRAYWGLSEAIEDWTQE